jgi:hypothetical protein
MFIVHSVAVAAALTDDTIHQTWNSGQEPFRVLETSFDPSGRLEYFLGRRGANIPAIFARSTVQRMKQKTKARTSSKHCQGLLGANSVTIRPNAVTNNTESQTVGRPILSPKHAVHAMRGLDLLT